MQGGRERVSVRPDGSADIDGLALVTDVNEQFDLEIDENVYTTVGGYVMGRLGRKSPGRRRRRPRRANDARGRDRWAAGRECVALEAPNSKGSHGGHGAGLGLKA